MSDIMEINKEFQNKNRIQNKEEAEWFRLANLDKAKEELEQAKSTYQTQKDALFAKHEKELGQARNNTLKDEYGQEIPIAMVKKPFGMRQEKAAERVARLTGIANVRYEKELRRLDFRIQRAQEKVAYYENEDIINHISDDELTDSYSEKRRKLLKNYLLVSVESDRGKLFSPEEEDKKAAFAAFLDAAAAYAKFDAQMVVERVRDKKSLLKLNEDTEEREAEITRYQEMLKKLATLKSAAGKDAALLKMAESYENLLSGIADGDLKVPREKKEQVIKLFHSIPCLNGGLFECLDKFDIDTETGKYLPIKYYDGFSSKDTKSPNGNLKYRAFIPNILFFAPEHRDFFFHRRSSCL